MGNALAPNATVANAQVFYARPSIVSGADARMAFVVLAQIVRSAAALDRIVTTASVKGWAA